MREGNKITFISLLQDEEFLDLARNYSWSDIRIQEYIARFPEQQKTIGYAFQFVKSTAPHNTLSPADEAGMRNFILDYAEKKKQPARLRRLTVNLSKVAAVLILALTGAYFLNSYFLRNRTLEKIAQNQVEVGEEAVLVLSDGSKHSLAAKESQIEYNADGTEIVVRDDKREQEKLSNTQNVPGVAVNQIVVPYGHRHSIVLSDGTKVQLNSGSKLVFPAEFKGSTREVFLRGEAFFEVSKKQGKTFIVKTDFLDLKVLGTSFNVSSYQDEKIATTVLVEGKVVVSQHNKLFRSDKIELNPGQGYFYSVANSSSEVREVDVSDFVLWREGVFKFKDQPLKEVVSRVQKYYNKTIYVDGEKLLETIISGKLVLPEDFDEMMNYLARTLEASYVIDNEQIYTLKK